MTNHSTGPKELKASPGYVDLLGADHKSIELEPIVIKPTTASPSLEGSDDLDDALS